MSVGMKVAAAVALASAIGTFVALTPRRSRPEPEALPVRPGPGRV